MRSRALVTTLKRGDAVFVGMVSSDQGAKSFLSHLVSDPQAKNTFRAWSSVCFRIPRLADGAFASINRVLELVLHII